MINAAQLRERLSYNPDTGLFTWRTKAGRDRATNSWNARYDGTQAGRLVRGYVRIRVDGREYAAHRLAWLYAYGRWPDAELDHADRDKANNRLGNLREATRSDNIANASISTRNTSGSKGVHWDSEKGKWQARIHARGTTKHIGYFDEKPLASAAYLAAARLHFGNFATDGRRGDPQNTDA